MEVVCCIGFLRRITRLSRVARHGLLLLAPDFRPSVFMGRYMHRDRSIA
jgi:hypothetical protein